MIEINSQKKSNFLINTAFNSTVILLVFLFFKVAFSYLFPFVFGFFLAFLMQKPAKAVSERLKIKTSIIRTAAVVSVYLVLAFSVSLILWYLSGKFALLPRVIKPYIEKLSKEFESFCAELNSKRDLKSESMIFSFGDMLKNSVENISKKLIDYISNIAADFAKAIPKALITFVITLVASCYTAKDYDKITAFFKEIIKPEKYKTLITVKEILTKKVLKMISGYMIIFLITAAELTIGLLLIGTKNFLVIATAIAIVDFLPVLGTGSILIPWSIILLIQKNIKQGIMMLVLYAVITVVRNFIEPKIVGSKIGVHPLLQLIAIFLGLKFSGLAGMFLFPVALITAMEYLKIKFTNTAAENS